MRRARSRGEDWGAGGRAGSRGTRPPDRTGKAALVLAVVALSGSVGSDEGAVPPPFAPPLAYAPLAGPLELTGGFAEYRIGHFHAGLDLGTGRRVGRSVLAPTAGHIERVRASGVGYGRSLYLRADDGRLLQFGHLDAFTEPVASYVRAAQDSSGQYEQDLWPEPGRFPARAGQRIAWTGESGAGGPHLHFEIRRGDMAYHPLRAGLSVRDTSPPSLPSLALEPLDDTSFVEGRVAPLARSLDARSETLRVVGRVRAVVGARDGVWRGVDRMVPWSVRMDWDSRWVECVFDSASWATDMAEGDYVYDAGRVVGDRGLVLWAPGGFRPRVIRSAAPLGEEAGTITVRPGDAPRPLRLTARDLGGGRVERIVVLRPPGRAERGPDTLRQVRGPGRGGSERLELASLPGGFLRVTDRGAPPGSRGVRIRLGGAARAVLAAAGGAGWSAVLAPEVRASSAESRIEVEGRDAEGRPWRHQVPVAALAIAPDDSGEVVSPGGDFRARFPRGAVFERGLALVLAAGPAQGPAELEPVGESFAFEPASLPLRRPVRVWARWPGSGAPERVSLYRRGSQGWEWLAATFDSESRGFVAESRRAGRFALLRDAGAPGVILRTPPRRALPGPYSRWAVEASVTEAGSGLDPRASYFRVDGRRVPTEWDAEERVLRWRPARPPEPGSHRVEAVAADRAGNTGRVSGAFVLD